VATGLVYGQTARHEFVNYDDDQYVYANPTVLKGLTAGGVVDVFTHFYSNNVGSIDEYHPLTWLAYMLDCQIYGDWPGGHHLTNLLLHAATSVLLLLVLERMTGQLWPSAFVAALFAVHPLRVESVAWVAELKDVLSGLFFVLTLWFYVDFVRKPYSHLRYLLLVLLHGCGLLCKPMGVTTPFVLLLLDYWPLRRITGSTPETGDRKIGQRWLVLIEKVPLLAVSLLSCVVTLLAQRGALANATPIRLSWRVMNVVTSYVGYLRLFFWPRNLAVFYEHPGSKQYWWQTVAALIVLAAITVLAVRWRRKCPALIVGWLWYLGMFVPVIGLVQVGGAAMADRYTYLPQIGLGVGLAWLPLFHRRRAAAALAATLLPALIWLAWLQTSCWINSEALWRHALACTPQNWLASNNMASVLLGKRQYDEALRFSDEAIAFDSQCVLAYFNKAMALAATGRREEAIRSLQSALAIDPRSFRGQRLLASLLVQEGRLDEAAAVYAKAVELAPGEDELMNEVAAQLKDRETAIADYRRALARAPRDVELLNKLAIALYHCGRIQEAVDHWRTAVGFKPDRVDLRYNLGRGLYVQGKAAEALAQWREAERRGMTDPGAMNVLAWTLATHPNDSLRSGPEAVAVAQRAVQITGGRDPLLLRTLAAAYAETARFADAASTAEQSKALADRQGNPLLSTAIAKDLASYRAGKPIREGPATAR
jgi:tetratricopeptide (TPR) repeat protein